MTDRMEKVGFVGGRGVQLDARLDLPEGPPEAFALFAHCFACSMHSLAASRISRALTHHGLAVLRFDFTGHGSSDGDVGNVDFATHVEDVRAAAAWLAQHHHPPVLLVGHSVGDAACVRAAAELPSVALVATLNTPLHLEAFVSRFGEDVRARLLEEGEVLLPLDEKPLRLTRTFLEGLSRSHLEDALARMRAHLLVVQGLADTLVPGEEGLALAACGLKGRSVLELEGADHLLSRPEDALYVADVLGAWGRRYLGLSARAAGEEEVEETPGVRVVERRDVGPFALDVEAGPHRLRVDEPTGFGGTDTGPTPYALLSAALGACTSMTVRLYAERKGWPLTRVETRVRHDKVHAVDCRECEEREGRVDRFLRELVLEGPLTPEQRERLLEIAGRCPVHRTLEPGVHVVTRLGGTE